MKKVMVVAACAISVALVFGACGKKEEPKTGMQSPHGPGGPAGVMMPKGETKTVVPDAVKGKWSAVVLNIEDKAKNKTQTVTVKLGAEYAVPNTNIKIKVGDFLPDFKMDGLTITSSSDSPNNPAVHVTVTEGGKEIFDNWLYSKFPSIHPFQHEKLGLTLKEGVKKS